MLIDYLKEKYMPGQPIFSTDLKIENMSRENLRQQLKTLTDKNELARFDNGIYYLPRQGRLKGYKGISANKVAENKYIENNGKRIGYYSGYTLANQLGLLEQVPNKREIVTNNTTAIVKNVRIGKQDYTIRKAPIEINNENFHVLQLLDLLKDLDRYADIDNKNTSKILREYIRRNDISRKQIEEYLPYFPLKVYKSIFETRLDNVFA